MVSSEAKNTSWRFGKMLAGEVIFFQLAFKVSGTTAPSSYGSTFFSFGKICKNQNNANTAVPSADHKKSPRLSLC